MKSDAEDTALGRIAVRENNNARRLRWRERIKWSFFPGLNLHARLRYKTLPKYFGNPANRGAVPIVLDAGCGNGMLSYQSYLKGNRVIGVSIKAPEIARNRTLFNEYHGISKERLQFKVHNLYDLESLDLQFDEIICTEVLEHIQRDAELCLSFFRVLRPGGVLHLCCPNAEHVDNRDGQLDESETGGHVRAGYTYDTYCQLLQPIGFELSKPIGLGGFSRQTCNKVVLLAQRFGGLVLGIPAFVMVLPFTRLDRGLTRHSMPFSIYVRARKPNPELQEPLP